MEVVLLDLTKGLRDGFMLKQALFLIFDVTGFFWGGYRERVQGNTKMCTYFARGKND